MCVRQVANSSRPVMNSYLVWVAFLCVLSVVSASAAQGVNARLLRQPDVSDSHITFVYSGDIWIAPKSGGERSGSVRPLARGHFRSFRPTAARSPSREITMAILTFTSFRPGAGPVPRVRRHPGEDRVIDWDAEGETVRFASGCEGGSYRFSQLYQASIDGGLPAKIRFLTARWRRSRLIKSC